jgi:nitrite reductase/ring-hydroxylating ferredoxin subunit
MPLYPVAKIDEIPPGSRKLMTVGKLSFGVFNVQGTFRAYRNICPHAGAPVCEGRISGTTLPSKVYEYEYGQEGCVLRCPWHGWEFDLRTGAHLVDPETRLKSLTLQVAPGPGCGVLEGLSEVPLERHGDTVFILLSN